MRTLALFLAIMIASEASAAAGRLPGEVMRPEYAGRVVRVIDGDTIDIEQANGTRLRIRLAGIDAPERGQPWSKVATEQLSDWLLDREVRVIWIDQQPGRGRAPGRVIGDVYLGQRWINRALVDEGLAWAYDAFLRDPSLCESELRARAAGRGLWRSPRDQWLPPWVYRARAGGRSEDWVATCPRRDLDRD